MDSQDKTRFEIQGKSSVKYHLKANHIVEAKRWFWTLNNAIQWAKDEAKEEERRRTKDAEVLRQAKLDQIEGRPSESTLDAPLTMTKSVPQGLAPPALAVPGASSTKLSTYPSRTTLESTGPDDDGSAQESYEQSVAQNEVNRVASHVTTATGPDGDGEDDEYGDYASSREIPSADKDAFNITAQSAKVQLDLLSNVASSLQAEKSKNPNMTISDPTVDQALVAYGAAVGSLKELVQNLLVISRDRDANWQYRLSKEAYLRQMWEESMAKVAKEHEELQAQMGESEDKRRRTKRALKEALENPSLSNSRTLDNDQAEEGAGHETPESKPLDKSGVDLPGRHRGSTLSRIGSVYDSDAEDEEFFDAIDSGEIEAEDLTKSEVKEPEEGPKGESAQLRAVKHSAIVPSFKGYEEPVRERLKMDYDNRPKISLWVCISIQQWIELICLGHPEIHDWQRHDQDDSASVFQRANLASPASCRGFGICRSP